MIEAFVFFKKNSFFWQNRLDPTLTKTLILKNTITH